MSEELRALFISIPRAADSQSAASRMFQRKSENSVSSKP
jgi:hypothetical protein